MLYRGLPFTAGGGAMGAGAGVTAGCGILGILDKSKLDKSGKLKLLKSIFEKSGIEAAGTGVEAEGAAGCCIPEILDKSKFDKSKFDKSGKFKLLKSMFPTLTEEPSGIGIDVGSSRGSGVGGVNP